MWQPDVEPPAPLATGPGAATPKRLWGPVDGKRHAVYRYVRVVPDYGREFDARGARQAPGDFWDRFRRAA